MTTMSVDDTERQRPTLSDRDIPLIVDLDGTLCRSDTLYEAVLGFVAEKPLSGAFHLLSWMRRGKAYLKEQLAQHIVIDPTTLIFNEAVLDKVREARKAGRKTLLVSASIESQVQSVSEHLGLFDDAVGTASGRNLGGREKADYLVERFGAGAFDYIGDATPDLEVWKHARGVIAVGANAALKDKIEAVSDDPEYISPPPPLKRRIASYFKAIRPHQWLKNTLIFTPPLAAHDFTHFGSSILAFISFCLIASSVYVVNDLLDLQADRAHPRKNKRPFAASEIPIEHGVILAGGLAAGSLLFALLVDQILFLAVLAAYYVTTFAYSISLKRKLILDVWTLAGLYTIRIVAGAAATGVTLSLWFLGFSLFLFLALASVKRHSELVDLKKRQGEHATGRAYSVDDIPVLMAMSLASGYCAVLVFALYVSSPEVSLRYSTPYGLWLICPLLLYWISRVVMLTHRGQMHDDPVVFAIRDRNSLVVGGLCAALIVASSVL